jgi:hypothetical protein
MAYFHEICTGLSQNPTMSQKKLQIWLPLLLAASVFLGMVFGYKLFSASSNALLYRKYWSWFAANMLIL